MRSAQGGVTLAGSGMMEWTMALSPKQIDEICGKMASGRSLRAICRDMGIGESTVRYALKSDPEAFAQAARARELGCDALADECIEISDDKSLEAADRRVRIETRLKLIGKWSMRYGDRVDHTVSGPDGGPVRVAHADVTDLARSLRNLAAGRETSAPGILTSPAPLLQQPEVQPEVQDGSDLL